MPGLKPEDMSPPDGVVDLRGADIDDDVLSTSREVVWALARELPDRPWAICDRHGRVIAGSEEHAPGRPPSAPVAEIELGREGHVLVVSAGAGFERDALESVAARIGARLFGVVVASKRQAREAEAAVAWAWSVAHADPVTHVRNARGWWHELGARMWTEGETSTVVVARIQLADLRELNAAQGHHGGDEILRLIADRLVAQLSRTDIVARFGGGDFAVLAYATDEATVRDRLAIALDIPGVLIRRGLAAHRPDEPIRTTVARADLALRP
jgi:diguanylate cyclase (GGDEF)-like protein